MPLVFVDAVGGGLAALAAGMARSLGKDALATSTAPGPLPAEAQTVLDEVGAKLGTVEAFRAGAYGADRVIYVGEGDPPVGVKADAIWSGAFYRAPAQPHAGMVPGDGDSLERLSAARIARDTFERRITAL